MGVEIKEAKDLGPSREVGIDAAAAEQVQSEVALGNEFIPEGEGKVGVSGGEASQEMVLVGLDGAFAQVGTVLALRCELVVHTLLGHAVLEQLGAFIV